MTDFETVYRDYFRDIQRYLLALCRDEKLSEELTEQVFFQALKALPAFRGACDIRTWLCTIARNVYRSHLRRMFPTEDIDVVSIPDPRRGMEEGLEDREMALAVHQILHCLPEPYKEVFSLRVFGQLSFADIGGLFRKTANWACVTYHRARQKIKDALEEIV